MFDINLAFAIKRVAVSFVPLMLGIILHEVAHGWVAKRSGDSTAALQGRLTLNPLPHVDPMGLLFFVLTSLTGPFALGWAKPIPIDPRNFRDVKRDIMSVAIAGPAANFLLAFVSALLFKAYILLFPPETWESVPVWQFFFLMFYSSVSINCALAWFNLIPIPPLDGSKILWSVLPSEWGWRYMQFQRYGFLLIILLLMTGLIGTILYPMISLTSQLLLSVL